MTTLMLRIKVLVLLLLTCSSVQAQETFEAQGLIREVDPIVRTINVAGSLYRVDEEVYMNDGTSRVTAIPGLRQGDIVAFNGVELPGGDRLITSVNLIRRDFKPQLPEIPQEQ